METSPPTEIPPDTTDIHAEIAELRTKIDTLMNDRVKPAVTRLADHAESAAHRATDQVGQLCAMIREKPLASVGLAAAGGYLFAVLCRR